ncbi:unnamed protein product [Ascophyllum nodosum]
MTYKRLPAVLLVVYLTAVTPVTKIEVVGGLPERELCVDGVWTPLKDTDEDPSRCISQGLKPAGPASQSAQQMRRGRVGFHHEDITADASLRSLWSSFRESLPGVAEDELKPRHPRVNHVQQATARRVGLHPAATGAAVDPSLYPTGGTYYHPIAVSLVSSDGSLVYYTTDGASPDETSSSVSTGGLIVVEESVTLRAVAARRDVSFASSASSEVKATFDVYPKGKCGFAYFVPHFTSSGYSGKVVEVDLKTNALGSVRLHGVMTDFADFYSTEGVGPYDGQVVMNDLAADGNEGLVGFWGGFSGNVDGTALGFLTPHFNGHDFHGKAVQVQLDKFRTNATRFCDLGGIMDANNTCLFTVLDLEEVDPDLRGFNGGFVHDTKAYFVPYNNGRGAEAKFVRVSASNFSIDSVEILDLSSVDAEVGGFFGGFAWEGYGYLVPSRSFQGPTGGVNSNLSSDRFAPPSAPLGYGYSTKQNSVDRMKPAYSGKLVRVDLTDFSLSGVEVLDLTMVDPELRGFAGGFAAGHWGYLVPFKNKEPDSGFSGKMVRIDLRTFDYAGVTVLDLTRVDESLRGFVGGFAHGRYAVLSPYANGNTTGNYHSRSQFGHLVAVDLQDFTEKGVKVVDLAGTSRQQVPYQPDPNLRGYVGGFALGPHAYLTPHFNGIFFGKVVRVDMREILTMAAGERATTFDGLQVLDLSLHSADAVGFSGAFHSWDASCS